MMRRPPLARPICLVHSGAQPDGSPAPGVRGARPRLAARAGAPSPRSPAVYSRLPSHSPMGPTVNRENAKEPAMLHSILVPLDGSLLAKRALAPATALARKLDVP